MSPLQGFVSVGFIAAGRCPALAYLALSGRKKGGKSPERAAIG